MSFSRGNPSPRYRELQALYRNMHQNGERFLGMPPEQTFPGKSLYPHRADVKSMIARTGAVTILDYGSGKGRQYDPQIIRDETGAIWPGMADYWDVDEVVCYDPCYQPFSELPQGQFDGVISTDVLEHCPQEDLPWIVEEIFGYASRFVFASVACYPARKRLPNGENAHCAILPVTWWSALVNRIAGNHPGLLWEFRLYSKPGLPDDESVVEDKIGNT
jgi:hypothetical protein